MRFDYNSEEYFTSTTMAFVKTIMVLVDLEGACPAHAPLRVQILSF